MPILDAVRLTDHHFAGYDFKMLQALAPRDRFPRQPILFQRLSNRSIVRAADVGLIATVPSVIRIAPGKSSAGRLVRCSRSCPVIRRPRRHYRDQARCDIQDCRAATAQRLPLWPKRSWQSKRCCCLLASVERAGAAVSRPWPDGNGTRLSCDCCGTLAH